MKKNLLALAVAGAFAAPAAALAQGSFVQIYGTINSDLGVADDKPTQALFEFLDGVLKK